MVRKVNIDNALYDTWDRKWATSGADEGMTPLGRRMFYAKKKALKELISRLSIQTVIEVGCGQGHTLGVYQAAGFDYMGIDVSPHAVAICRQKGLQAETRAVEKETGLYDLVSSDGMLEHFLNFEPMAMQLMRISQRFVLLIQPNHGSFWGRTAVYLSEILRGSANVYEYNYRINDFISGFVKNGFRVQENIPVFHDVFRLLLFEKEASSSR